MSLIFFLPVSEHITRDITGAVNAKVPEPACAPVALITDFIWIAASHIDLTNDVCTHWCLLVPDPRKTGSEHT